ncbi:MAG: type II secretion system protein [Leptolyngbyaceae cyanobacterium SL_7_1]|nr:type II secretion system protein [Leptolyngbyaceae cyanobacterium SL_7_1]
MTHLLLRELLHSQRSRLMRSQTQSSIAAEAGLGLLECLVAIIVIGLTVAMITPPLYIAAGTRVQNRRAEQAFQLAQAEIDQVKVRVARGDHRNSILPAPAGADATLQSGTPGPSSIDASKLDSVNPNCPGVAPHTTPTPVAEARRVDVDGDCTMDFLVQVFRSNGVVSATEVTQPDPRPTQFRMGVRVYSFIAEDNLGNLQVEQASLQLTSGQGSQASRPLAVVFSDLYWSDRSTTLCNFHTGTGNCF